MTYSVQGLPRGATFNPSTKTFTWTPDYDQAGNYQITFIASDGTIDSSQTVDITVDNVNRPPVLSPIANKIVNEHGALTFTLAATDLDGDSMTYSVQGLPRGATFNPSTKTFTWTPDYDQSGTYQVTFLASDGTLDNSQTVNITVSNVNRPPVLSPIVNKVLNENGTLTFTLSATDPDGDSMTYSVQGLPQGATFNPSTKTFTWTPGYDQAGNYQITFIASDGTIETYQDVNITVDNVNRPPVFSTIANKLLKENETLTFTLAATDPDGDSMTYSVQGLPQGASFDPATGTFTWTPGYNQSGNYQVTFIASDGTLTSSKTVNISIDNVDRPPVFNPIANQLINENGTLTFTLSATDPDGDSMTYSVQGLPQGASFDTATGTFTWTPDSDQSGNYQVTFIASDGTIESSNVVNITVVNVDDIPVTKILIGVLSALTETALQLGNDQIAISAETLVYDKNGTQLTLAEFLTIYNNDPTSTNVNVTATKHKVIQNVNGVDVEVSVWTADRIDVIEAPTQHETGFINNLYNPSGLSIMNGVIASTASNTISFGGENIKVLDGAGTTILDSAGNAISGTAAEKIAKLETIRENLAEEGKYLTIKLVAMKNGSDWEAEQIIITSTEPFLSTTNLTGELASIDTSTWTVVFDGTTMNLANAAITDIEGQSITKEDLAQFLQDNVSNGAGTFITVEAKKINDEWVIETAHVISDATGHAAINGLLGNISYDSPTVGTVIISGQTFNVLDSTGIIKDAKGNDLTLKDLSEIAAYNNLSGITTEVETQFNVTTDGLVLTGLNILTSTDSYLDMSSKVTGINLVTRTITLTGGLVCQINDNTKISDSSGTIENLDWLNSFFVNADQTGDVYVTVEMDKSGINWVANTIKISQDYNATSSITSVLEDAKTAAGTFGIYITTGSVTIGGIAAKLTVDTNIKDAGGSYITPEQLKAIFDNRPNSQILVSAVMAEAGEEYVIKEISITNILNTSMSITASDMQILSYDASGNPKEIVLNGTTIEVDNDLATEGFFTNIEITYLNEKNNSLQIAERDRSQTPVNNTAYDSIGGLKGLILHEYPDIISADKEISFDVKIVKVGDTWHAEKITANANLNIENTAAISGVVQSVSTDGNVLMLDGIPITVRGNIITDPSGKYYTLSEFAALYNANAANGVDTSLGGKILRGYALQTGQVSDSQSSIIRKDVVLGTDPALNFTLHFKWKVSSEANDYFKFFIDGNESSTVTAISGEVGWQDVYVNVSGGAHTLEWKYIKDASGKAGFDAAWLDDVAIQDPAQVINFATQVSGQWDLKDDDASDGDNTYKLRQSDLSAGTKLAVLDDGYMQNGSVETTFKMGATGTGDYVSFYFKLADDYSSGYEVRITRAGAITLSKFTGGLGLNRTVIKSATITGFTATAWNKLKVSFKDNLVDIYVNDTSYISKASIDAADVETVGLIGIGTTGIS
ncbi:MAG: putative Ig domain-containing protein, partial [Candidatus Brocadiia bacterium]